MKRDLPEFPDHKALFGGHEFVDRIQLLLGVVSLAFFLMPQEVERSMLGGERWVHALFVLLFLGNTVAFLFCKFVLLRSGTASSGLHHAYLDLVALLFVTIALPDVRFAATIAIGYEIVILVLREVGEQHLWSLFLKTGLNAAQIMAMSFLLLIFVGTLLLMLPFATNDGEGLSLIDALFTVTSAVCVTGLTVWDTGSHFSLFGQLVILALIQIGAFGMMTSSAFLFVLTGRRMKHREGKVMRDLLNVYHTLDIPKMLVEMLTVTLLFEGIGAICLTICWYPHFGDLSTALYYGIFHAVSAFCNAGFSLFQDSLMAFRSDFSVNLVISSLIIGGGLGFHVIVMVRNLSWGRWRGPGRGKTRLLDLHSRMVLRMTGILLVGGMLFFLLSEYDASMNGFHLLERLEAAFFLSVTARTAGFNTIDMALLSNSSILILLLLMFIGASPGSTGGGIKTTTFGVTLYVLRSLLQGRRNIAFGNRLIPPSVVNKALAIFITSGMILTLFLSLLYMVERAPFEQIFFEAVSAFGTVGLSLGLTPTLSIPGKLIITALMFVGRVGPLTLAFAVGERKDVLDYDLPYGRILVG